MRYPVYRACGCPFSGAASFVQISSVSFIYFWLQISTFGFLGVSPLLKQCYSVIACTSSKVTAGTVHFRLVKPGRWVTSVGAKCLLDEALRGEKLLTNFLRRWSKYLGILLRIRKFYIFVTFFCHNWVVSIVAYVCLSD